MPSLHELREVQVVVRQADELAAQQRQRHVQLHAPVLGREDQPGRQVLGEAGTDVTQRFEEGTVSGYVQPPEGVVEQAVEQLKGGKRARGRGEEEGGGLGGRGGERGEEGKGSKTDQLTKQKKCGVHGMDKTATIR